MTLVTVSLGSNQARTEHLGHGLDALGERFGKLQISRVFESEPVGIALGDNFYNLVVAFTSDWSPGRLQAWAKQTEARHGKATQHRHVKPLDIDLLSVGELCGEQDGVRLPRDDITRHAFVLQPLAELLPEVRHPRCQTPYAALWQRFALNNQRLWAVDFYWRGERISCSETPAARAATQSIR